MLTLRRPLRRKLRMRWVFDVSKVNESSFFLNRTSLTILRVLLRIFYKKNCNFLRNGRVRVKPVGRVRVKPVGRVRVKHMSSFL